MKANLPQLVTLAAIAPAAARARKRAQEMQRFLGNDLSIAGVDAAKSLFAKTKAEGIELQKSMDALIAELNTVAATVTPAKAAPQP